MKPTGATKEREVNTRSNREAAIQLILTEVRKGYTIDEAVSRLTSKQHYKYKGRIVR